MKVCDFCGKPPHEDTSTGRVSCTNPDCEMKDVPFWYSDWQDAEKQWKLQWKDFGRKR